MVKHININYGISYCFGAHEVVTGADCIQMASRICDWREQPVVMCS
jgi:hypothetical protein